MAGTVENEERAQASGARRRHSGRIRIPQRQCETCRRWFSAWDPGRERCFLCDPLSAPELHTTLDRIKRGLEGVAIVPETPRSLTSLSAAQSSRATPPSVDRRSALRLGCNRLVQVWRPESLTPIGGQLGDLSLGGCYVKLAQPAVEGTEVQVLLLLYGVQVRAEAVVRRVEPGRGMGLQFSHLAPADLAELQRVLAKRAPEGVPPARLLAPAALVERLDAWYRTRRTLSVEEYERLRALPGGTAPGPC